MDNTGSRLQESELSLRPEAQPAKWEALDRAQKQAIKRLTQMIAEAANGLPLPSEPSRSERTNLRREDRSEKISRTAFLSGGRGTGKTTVLYSLKEFTDGVKAELDPDDNTFARNLRKLQERVIWLDDLDMEPIKRTPSILMAIFARIEAAFLRSNTRNPTGGEESSDTRASLFSGALASDRDALVRFKRLQSDIAVSWESNIAERQGHLDADSYAVELMREERARLSLMRDLDRVLDNLAQDGFVRTAKPSPLFVLSVDDLDLNPHSCLQLLRLLRQISTPRLFFVVLGDETLAELVINLQISNDLAGLASQAGKTDLLSVSPRELARRAGNVAANALRKLLPPAQRVHLEPMSLREAVYFRPLANAFLESPTIPSLYAIMARLPILTSSPGHGENLLNFLLGPEAERYLESGTHSKPIGDDVEWLGNPFYSGRFLLKAPPRRLVDLWLAFHEIARAGEERNFLKFKSLIEYFALKCQRSLLGDPALGPEERRLVEEGIEKDDSERWRLRSLPVQLVSETVHFYEPIVECPEMLVGMLREMESIDNDVASVSSSTPAEPREELFRSPELRFYFSSALRWRFAAGGRTEGSLFPRELEPETASELTVFHDLVALENKSRDTSPLLDSLAGAEAWAGTVWSYGGWEPVAFSWPLPACGTIWALDWFRKSWNETLEDVRVLTFRRSHTRDQDRVSLLALRWIFLGNSIMLERFDNSQVSNLTHWQVVVDQLEELATDLLRKETNDRAAHWICGVCNLLMPEMGILSSFRHPQAEPTALNILSSETIGSVCRRYRFILQNQRAERFGELLDKGNKHLYWAFDELTPTEKQNLFRPATASVYRRANRPVPPPRRSAAKDHPAVQLITRSRAARRKK